MCQLVLLVLLQAIDKSFRLWFRNRGSGVVLCHVSQTGKKTTLICHVIVRVDIFITVDHLRTNDMASLEYQQGQLQPKHRVISTMVSTCILRNDG